VSQSNRAEQTDRDDQFGARALVKYSSDWRDAWQLSERSFRNWRTAGIIPKPDGNILGRDFWTPAIFAKTNAELLSGKHSRVRRPPHLMPVSDANER
jgi:hypothetical protein